MEDWSSQMGSQPKQQTGLDPFKAKPNRGAPPTGTLEELQLFLFGSRKPITGLEIDARSFKAEVTFLKEHFVGAKLPIHVLVTWLTLLNQAVSSL